MPTSAEGLNGEGLKRSRAGDTLGALTYFEKAHKKDPTNPKCGVLLAFANFSLAALFPALPHHNPHCRTHHDSHTR